MNGNNNSRKENTFHLGICMAGAVSAGAYTAGVMDYLIEALENWEKAKQLQKEGKLQNVPEHSVNIDVMGGASAGGMTAIMAATGILKEFPHVSKADIENLNMEVLDKNPLYKNWVGLTDDESGQGMMKQLLSNDDIYKDPKNKRKVVYSFFNSHFIDKIATRQVMNFSVDDPFKRAYVSQDLELFTTLTSLRGIHYQESFLADAGLRVHRMSQHSDMAHFQMVPDPEIKSKNGRIPISFKGEGLNKKQLKDAAMATGAFPVGLKSRTLERKAIHIEENEFINLNQENKIPADIKGNFLTQIVDGGTFNNEPFSLTLNVLDSRLGVDKASRKTEVNDFYSCVMMVDPFPNHEDREKNDYVPDLALKNVVGRILDAMINELRLKEDILDKAYSNDDYTKYLVLPSRSGVKDGKSNHIACGAMDGFSGFYSRSFREHDFLLGKRNCQRFLQNYFSVPKSCKNPIVEFGYSNIEDFEPYERKLDNGKTYLPIIPDIRVVEKDGVFGLEVPVDPGKLQFPKVPLSYVESLEKLASKRFSAILSNIGNNSIDVEKKEEDELVLKVRNKGFFKKVGAFLLKPFIRGYLFLGKRGAKKIGAEQFTNWVIRQLNSNELIDPDN